MARCFTRVRKTGVLVSLGVLMNRSVNVLVAVSVSGLLVGGAIAPSASALAGSTDSTVTAAVDKGLLRAKQIVAKYAANPKTIGVTTKLTKKPRTGLTIAYVYTGTSTSQVVGENLVQAASLFGWDVKLFPGATTPEKYQQLMSAALDLKPTAIVSPTSEPSAMGQSIIQRSIDQNTFIVCTSCIEAPPAKNWNTRGISGLSLPALQGQILAAAVVAASGGTANTQVISAPLLATSLITTDTFNKSMKAMCPKCKVTENQFAVGDVGTKIPGAMVSIVQRDPSVNWIVGIGAFLTGVQPALSTAGFGGGKVQLASYSGSPANIAALRAGTQAAEVPSSLPINAYRAVDAVARWVNKQPQLTTSIPLQLLTNVNVNSAVYDSAGVYLAVPGALDQFKRIWLMK